MAHTLLHNTRASAVVNGWVSQPRTWGAGVRQGCSLAPAMYLFVAWALRCWLRTCSAVGLSVARHLIYVQYADDCVGLLGACRPEDTVRALRAAMSTFTLATCQHLYLSKSCILPLGKPPHPLPTSLCDMPVRPRARTLGITFFNAEFWALKPSRSSCTSSTSVTCSNSKNNIKQAWISVEKPMPSSGLAHPATSTLWPSARPSNPVGTL